MNFFKKFLIYFLVLISAAVLLGGCSKEEKEKETETDEVFYSTIQIYKEYMDAENLTVDYVKEMFGNYGVDESCITGDSYTGLTIKIPYTQKGEIEDAVTQDAKDASTEFCDIKKGYKLIYYTCEYRADFYCDEEIPVPVINAFVKRVRNNMLIEDILSGSASNPSIIQSTKAEDGTYTSRITTNVKSMIDGSPLVFAEQETVTETEYYEE